MFSLCSVNYLLYGYVYVSSIKLKNLFALMQKQKFEIMQPREIIKCMEDAFTTMPIIPKDCVKALNKFSYNLVHQDFTPEMYNSIIFLILRGFTSKDNYLKSMIYAILERVSPKTRDGIVALNSIIKDVDDKHIPSPLKNSAYRTLFTYLPKTLKNDFLKFIKISLLNEKERDNSVCIATEFFPEMAIDTKITDRIDDYHLCFFNKLPINKYSSMLEINRMLKNGQETSGVGKYLGTNVDSIVFIEAAKSLLKMKQEYAVMHVDKAVSTLRLYLKRDSVDQLVAMKILNQLSVNFPTKVSKANKDIEDLINNTSKTVGMLAILTLLKTGNSETARQLATKLESLMHIMSEPCKIMAIEAIERLSKDTNDDFSTFLKKLLSSRGSIEFKRFILRKIENVLHQKQDNSDMLKYLCSYIEDPDYYQISMDILGIVSGYLENHRDLVHIYNRIILDNYHVRHSVYQTLYDLDSKLNTIEVVKTVDDAETFKFRSFLASNCDLKRGQFDLNELGDLKEDVMKYLDNVEEEELAVNKPLDLFIKECRSIEVTPESADVQISVVKKVYEDKVLLCYTFINKMSKVILNSGVLSIMCNDNKHRILLTKEDFKEGQNNGNIVYKEVEIAYEKDANINGVFEYQICLEDDLNETEDDEIQLLPFDINILDLVKPIPVNKIPESKKSINIKLKLKQTEAISKIVGKCNMFLIAEKNSVEVQGLFEEEPVVIRVNASYSKYTTMNIEICCNNDELADDIAAVFD